MSSSHSALSPELIAAIEDGACVLTPNQRSAHWLKLLYANHAVTQGRTAWATPAIHSFNNFVAQLWRTHGDGAERVLSTEQSQLVWERVVAESRWSELLLSPQAASNSAYRAWERLQSWCITRTQVAEQATEGESSETQALVDWSQLFEDLCRERSWLPIALLPQRLLALRTVPSQLIVTLTEDLAPNHRALVNHLVACGTRWRQISARIAPITPSVTACDSSEAELQLAAAWAKQQLRAGTKSIAIVVPELDQRAPQVRRIFADVFAQAERTFDIHAVATDQAIHGPSVAIASYHHLADFPIVRAAQDLLQLVVGRASSTLVGGVLRNPFLQASGEEASLRALADARLRGHSREHYDLVSLERIATHCPQLIKCLHDAQALRLTTARALPSAMAEQFIALWRAFGWPGEQALNSDEQQVVSRLQASLAEFGALDELLGPLTFANAVREFEQLTRNTSFEPRSAPTPITIVDAQAVDGLQFDAAWIVGMDETRWPPAATPDPFIPIALQIEAGMPHASARLTREHARRKFLSLQTIADRVVLSWARKDRDIELLPSPWLAEMATTEDAPAIESNYAARLFASRPTLEVIEERSAPALVDSHARGGTRIFELQSLCPFRAFAELRLNAKPLDQVVPSIDARERGTLIHAALADLWQTLGGSAGLQTRTAEQLEVQVRTVLARHAEKFLEGASAHRVRMLQIEQDLATQRILTLVDLDRQRSPFRVIGRPETQEQATVGALTFELRLDRMDELLAEQQRGERIIVDYKTGSNVSTQSWTRERPEQPQLPLYAVTHPHALAAVAFATVGAKDVSYQGVARDDGLLPGIKAFNDKYLPAPYTKWNGLLAYWESVITRLANQFANGEAQVDPLPTACRYCHLSTLCRVNDADPLQQDEEAS